MSVVRSMMLDFAARTGLLPPSEPPRRYLWTDAFAVCNFLELYGRTGEERFRKLALALISQVHETLGRHRPDDRRSGWISGLSEQEGRAHPTAGGLRIGKVLPEREPGQQYNQATEWDRDGQYFHYLTKWMHALSRAARVTGIDDFIRLALELAQAGHTGFTHRPAHGGPVHMSWKMSIDRTRPLVSSMGQHDPLDGFITYHELCACAPAAEDTCRLNGAIADFAPLLRNRSLATDDPLGLGGLLADAYRLVQLLFRGAAIDPALLENILASARTGLESFLLDTPLALPAAYRLAFRELGLSIGLHAAGELNEFMARNSALFRATASADMLEDILSFSRMAHTIENFWLEPANRRSETWTAHYDINEVMLATSLAPGEFLAC